MAAFDPDHNHALKWAGARLLAYTRKHGLYNFVIDCFGRVFRIVAEGDAANHAGHSVWADGNLIYLGLNDSFVGVSFEGQTNSPSAPSTPAQIAAARLLTEMLRSKYSIDAGNCVTHAQVSVNPGNMQLGYHTDWAVGFPFRELGLGNGYEASHSGHHSVRFQLRSGFSGSSRAKALARYGGRGAATGRRRRRAGPDGGSAS